MSRNFHNFTRERISPPEIFPVRPVVLNTWEACYFDINEDVLVNFAKEAVKYDVRYARHGRPDGLDPGLNDQAGSRRLV